MKLYIAILSAIILAAAAKATTVSTLKSNYVKAVTQSYKKPTNDRIIAQITRELQASYIYQAYASYFQRADVALPGIQKFFAAASLEEREHAQMLIDYINQRGGHVVFDTIDLTAACSAVLEDKAALSVKATDERRMCICNYVSAKTLNALETTSCGDRSAWKNGLYAFEDALATEKFVNDQLLALHKSNDDVHLGHLLEHHFLDEQVDAIYKLGTHVTRLRSFSEENLGANYKLGEYMFDLQLQKSGGGH